MRIELKNLPEHSISMEESIFNWMFNDIDGNLPSAEHLDRIFILNKDAAKFLWEIEMNARIICYDLYFNDIEEYNSEYADNDVVKKYLYNLGIPFQQKVFMALQPTCGFVRSWKMVIKYAHQLFFTNDQSVWDDTFNWKLEFHHDGMFTFGKNRR